MYLILISQLILLTTFQYPPIDKGPIPRIEIHQIKFSLNLPYFSMNSADRRIRENHIHRCLKFPHYQQFLVQQNRRKFSFLLAHQRTASCLRSLRQYHGQFCSILCLSMSPSAIFSIRLVKIDVFLSFFLPILGLIAAFVFRRHNYIRNYKACRKGVIAFAATLGVCVALLLLFIVIAIL